MHSAITPVAPEKKDGHAQMIDEETKRLLAADKAKYPNHHIIDDETQRLLAADKKLKTRIRIFRFITRLVSFGLSVFITYGIAYSLAKYLLTKDQIITGTNQHPWANPTKLWPTIMLLSIATITMLMNLITLISYLAGIEAANRVGGFLGFFGYMLIAVHVIVWAVATGLFMMASRDQTDLWGYSCALTTPDVVQLYTSFLNFGSLCTLQTGSFYIAIAEAVTYFLTFITYIFIAWRVRNKKKLARLMEQKNTVRGFEAEYMIPLKN